MPVGLPYNINNPRPVKNGQPPPCMGQCTLNIGARKVGAAMKRLPQLYYGDKEKDQILQKWDPVSKRMVNIHDNAPIITMLNEWNLNYNIFTALWSQSKGSSVELEIFTNSTNSIEGATPVLSAIILPGNQNINTYVTNYTSVFRNFYFFTIRPINYTVSPTQSPIYQLNWYVNSWMPTSVGGVSSILVRGIAIDGSGNTYSSDVTANRIVKTTSSGVSTVLLTVTGPLGLAVYSNILYITNSSGTLRRYNLTTGVFMADIIIGAAIRALVIDSQNNIYVQEANGVIRKRTPDGTITTILIGTGGPCGTSMGYYLDSLNNEYIYYTETTNFVVNRTLVLRNGVVPVPTGIITTVAGTDTSGYNGDNISAISAQFRNPKGVSVDSAGNIYIADEVNHRIRKLTLSTGNITTVAGTDTSGYNGDNISAISAQLMLPVGVTVDSSGNIYIADTGNHRIRMVSGATQTKFGISMTVNRIYTIAGTGLASYGGDGATGTSARLSNPAGVSVDSAGNIYIADTGNNRIRKVDTDGIITTVAGAGGGSYDGEGSATLKKLNIPTGVSVDSAGNIYIADTGNNRIRKVTAGTITTLVGTGSPGFSGDGGPAIDAQLNRPRGVTVDSSGDIYIADTNNNRIRKVTAGTITTLAISAQLSLPNGVTVDSVGNIYIADLGNQRIRMLPAAFVKERVAGTGFQGYSGDGGLAVQATLKAARGVAVDTLGNVIVMDNENDAIRYIPAATGIIHTICGTGVAGTGTNGVVGTASQVRKPWAVVFKDPSTAYFTDSENNTSRVLNLTGHY